jgi:hypothetical protein
MRLNSTDWLAICQSVIALCFSAASQSARVREMERNGELEPIPEVSTAIQ